MGTWSWGATSVLLLTGCVAGHDSVDWLEAQPSADEAESLESSGALVAASRPVAQVPGFDVAIELDGADVALSWSAQPGATDYTVWHAADAYFEPGDPGSTALATGPSTSYAHAVAGDGVHHYYRVVAHANPGDEVSTIVGKYAHLLYSGYNKIPQPLVTGMTDAAAFSQPHTSYLHAVYLYDGPSQGFQYWSPGGGTPFTYALGQVPIADVYGLWAQVYEDVGHVPDEGGIELLLSPGLNIATVPLEFGDTTAGELLAAVPSAWRVGRWDPIAQDRVWYDGSGSDFAVEAGRDVYVEVWQSSMWPPDPGSQAPPPSGNPLNGIGAPQAVATGLLFTEGALWLADEGALLFTDLEADELWRYDPGVGTTRLRAPSDRFANGLAEDPQGRRIECQHKTQRVARFEADGSETVIASEWQGQTLNSPDDAVTGSDGSLYFTDPTIGGMYHLGNVQYMPLGFQGVYRVDPNGGLHLVDDGLDEPAGIALSPAGDTLYVSDWGTGLVHAYPVNPDGTTGAGVVFNTEAPGADSMCVDVDGNLFVTTNQGIWALRPDGTQWGLISLPEEPANCAFGGPDMLTMYVTARTSVYTVEMVIPGAPMFGG